MKVDLENGIIIQIKDSEKESQIMDILVHKSGSLEVKRLGRPKGSVSKKKKHYPMGKQAWSKEEDVRVVQAFRKAEQEGDTKWKVAVQLGKEMGRTYKGVYARWNVIKRNEQPILQEVGV